MKIDEKNNFVELRTIENLIDFLNVELRKK
jgi:hypothetical protein